MATVPTTQVKDVVVPEIFSAYTQQLTEQKSRIIQSGLAVRDPSIDMFLAGGGITFNVPSFRDLDDDDDRVSNDSSVPFNVTPEFTSFAGEGKSPEFPPDPSKIQATQEVAVRLSRNKSWSSMDLTSALIGIDPMGAIADRVAYYWTRRLQSVFIATWNGVIADNIANDSSDYANDITGSAFIDGVTNFSAEAFLDAAVTMGDSMEDLTAIVVHSVVYNRMQKNNLIDFIPDSDGRAVIRRFLGREVIVDDGVPRKGNNYESWIFGAGATRIGVGQAKIPTEVERKPGGGNGGGQEVLYNRVEWVVHPVGHAFVGTPPNGGPYNSGTSADDLDEAASWDRVYPERKQIKFARLVTREA